MATQLASPTQLHALFNILSHREVYAEIEGFKYADAIQSYGPPFQTGSGSPLSTSPSLQSLFTQVLMRLPGLKTVAPSFWTERVLPFIKSLSLANLSESYDKGVIGQRRTVSTAISTLLEYPTRGYFGSCPTADLGKTDRQYDESDPRDVAAAWHDLLQGMVYGNTLDELFSRAAETDKLSEHSSLVRAAHKFIVLNLASLMHYTLIVSPKGPALLALLENAHKLVPYLVIRQTLRIGNAATMINGMVRIVLAKASVGAVTNWLGMSQGADEGMNLMQTIISTVLGWDIRKLKSRISKIEKDKDAPSKDHLQKLREYSTSSQKEQETLRNHSSSKLISIVTAILDEPLPPPTHEVALEYLSLILSVRDREQLIANFCRQNPDLLTPIARDLVTAYDPVIRAIHQAVDLSGTVADAQAFLDDLIRLSKPRKGELVPVQEYVRLLEKHQGSSHRFIHQVANHGKEITEEYRQYTQQVAAQFRNPNIEKNPQSESKGPGAGALADALNDLLVGLPPENRTAVLAELDTHATYLKALGSESAARTEAVLAASSTSSLGPGMFLARWQALLDATPITPAEAAGKVRRGGSFEVQNAARVDTDGEHQGRAATFQDIESKEEQSRAPSVDATVRLLEKGYKEILKKISASETEAAKPKGEM